MFGLNQKQRRVLLCCGAAALLATMDGSALFLVLPAVAAEFHAKLPGLANLGSVVALGAVGALPLGMLADRRGRRLMVVLGTAGFGLFDVLSALAPNLGWLAAARVAAVVFETVVQEIALIMVVEEMAAEHRGLGAAALTLAAAAGAAITVVAYPFLAPHWRLIYAAGGAAVPVALLLAWALPETGAWEQARDLPALAWRGPWIRRLTIAVASAGLSAIFYGPIELFVVLYGSSELHLRPGPISVVVFASGVAGLLAYPAGGWLTDRLGRRLLGVGLAAGNALTAGVAFLGGFPLYLGGNVAFTSLNSAAGPVFGAWTTELFPTRARVTAEVMDVVAGAAGTVLGLQATVLLAARIGLAHAILSLLLFAIVGSAVLLLLPETRGAPLEA